MNKIRICHIINADVWGGVEELLKLYLNQTKSKSEFEFYTILFNDGKLADELKQQRVNVKIVKETRYNFLYQLIHIYFFLKRHRIQIVHTHKYKENILGGLAGAFAQVPVMIKTVHGLTEFYSGFSKLRVQFFEMIDHILTKAVFHRVIVVSKEIKIILAKRYPKKLFYLINAIEFPEETGFEIDRKKKRPPFVKENLKIVGSLGRLAYVKGYDILVKAAKLVLIQRPDICFIIFGEGKELGALTQQAEEAGISNSIFFPGFVTNRFDHLSYFDLFLLPSRHEGVPIALLEAMAARVPIISTRVGGIPKIVQHGFTGYLVEPENPEELASACLYLLNNLNIARMFADHAFQFGRREFSAEQYRSKLNEFYRQMISSSRPNFIKRSF